jgi:hypothetical protein
MDPRRHRRRHGRLRRQPRDIRRGLRDRAHDLRDGGRRDGSPLSQRRHSHQGCGTGVTGIDIGVVGPGNILINTGKLQLGGEDNLRLATLHDEPPDENPGDLLTPGGSPIGTPSEGGDARIRDVPGVDGAGAEDRWWKLAASGTPVDDPRYNGDGDGIQVDLPDGGRIGFRPEAGSGGPAIDVKIPGLDITKLHSQMLDDVELARLWAPHRAELRRDYVGLWEVVHQVRAEYPAANDGEVRTAVLLLVQRALETREAEAGQFQRGRRGLGEVWSGSADQLSSAFSASGPRWAAIRLSARSSGCRVRLCSERSNRSPNGGLPSPAELTRGGAAEL